MMSKLISRKFWFVALGIVSTIAEAMSDQISPEKAMDLSTALAITYVVMEGLRDIALAWKGTYVSGRKGDLMRN
ncbi:MAG: hypothetical protein EXR59_02400 [Dehalococcoidia bacterium]|nr:hypothetical protein [Dehalococcoidia bacterium]